MEVTRQVQVVSGRQAIRLAEKLEAEADALSPGEANLAKHMRLIARAKNLRTYSDRCDEQRATKPG